MPSRVSTGAVKKSRTWGALSVLESIGISDLDLELILYALLAEDFNDDDCCSSLQFLDLSFLLFREGNRDDEEEVFDDDTDSDFSVPCFTGNIRNEGTDNEDDDKDPDVDASSIFDLLVDAEESNDEPFRLPLASNESPSLF